MCFMCSSRSAFGFSQIFLFFLCLLLAMFFSCLLLEMLFSCPLLALLFRFFSSSHLLLGMLFWFTRASDILMPVPFSFLDSAGRFARVLRT